MKKQSLFLILFISLFVSCQNAVFLPNPNVRPDRNDNKEEMLWHAPENLIATQGRKQYIKLTWKPVGNVKRYNIYRAKNAFDVFEQIGETKDQNCEFEIKSVDAGYDAYYRVTAVDPAGNESEMSNIERATTLAQPIINDINAYEDNGVGKVNVSWFMNNLDAYSNKPIHYDVVCYDNTKKEVARLKSENSNNTNICFENLNPNTPYLFKVEVYNGENESEESNVVDAVTARHLRPDPVKNLTVSQGNSLNQITISFELPGFVDIAVGKNQYEPNPLYFKIYRRLYKEGENKEQFKLIKADFGVNKDSKDKIDYTKVKFGNTAEEYTPGNVVSFIDDDFELKRGEKYEYKVQSFAYCERVITSDKSVAVSKGWLLPTFTFETQKLNYTFEGEGEARKKISATLKFDFKMDTFGIPYKFKITEIKRGINDGGEVKETDLTEATSVKEINDYTRKFNDLNKEAGYYKYKITVLTDKDIGPESYEAVGESLVTDSMDIPVIGDIKVTSGYADKIEFEWNWSSTNKYTLKYWDTINGETVASGEFTNDELLKNHVGQDEFVKYYDITARPGVTRTYQLVIDSSGFEVPSSKMEGTIPLKPELTPNYSYDKISVGVKNPSDKANYKFSATFEDTTLNNTYEIKESKNTDTNLHFDFDIVKKAASKNATAIDATVAGAKVKVVVTESKPLNIRTYHNGTDVAAGIPENVAKLGTESGYTEEKGADQELTSEITTAIVGQALMNVSASEGTYSDYIEVKWNKVLGADNYVIFRDRYHMNSNNKKDLDLQGEDSEKYIVTLSESNKYTVYSPDENLGKFVSITYDNSKEEFTLKDSYRPYDVNADVGSTWKKGQSEITWGAPNKYTVVPVLSSNDAESSVKDKKNIVTIDEVKIENSKNALGGTKGFGWNVQSSKGTYFENSSGLKVNNGINVTWTEPYFGNKSGYFVFRKDVNGDGNWKKLSTSVNVNSYVDKNVTQGNLYDYAVVDVNYAKPNPDPIFISDQRTGIGGVEVKDALGFMLPKPTISSVTDTNDGTEEIKFSGQSMNGVLNDMIDGYVVQVRNNNIDSNWHDIKDEPITEENKREALFTEIVNNENGLLKVLRDYKHYFRICAYKNVNGEKVYSQADNDITDGIMTDYIKWGSRQITIDEFAKAAIIGMSTGMEKERGDRGCHKEGDGKPGLKSTSSYNAAIWDTDFTLTFNYKDYVANHKSKGLTEDVNAVSINGTLYARGGLLNAWQKHYWTSSPISVTYMGNNNTGTISFNGKDSKNAGIVNRSAGVIEVTWNGVTKQYNMGNNTGDPIKPLPFPCGEGYLNNSSEWQ